MTTNTLRSRLVRTFVMGLVHLLLIALTCGFVFWAESALSG